MSAIGNVLVIEPSGVAVCALQGMLARGGHRSVVAANVEEGWRLLRELVVVDLLIMDLDAKGKGLAFLRRLRADVALKELPVVIYSDVRDVASVRQAAAFKVQAYLAKPYNDQIVHQELAKALAYPWRALQFEQEKSFCAQLGFQPAELRTMRDNLMAEVEHCAQAAPSWGDEGQALRATSTLSHLADDAETAGVWAVANYARELEHEVECDRKEALAEAAERFTFIRHLTYYHLNPDTVPDGFLSEDERGRKGEAAQRERWMKAAEANGEVIAAAEVVERKVDELSGCPAVDSVAAAFQMTANGMASSLGPVTDLVGQDPGLAAQTLAAANRLPRDGATPVEDVRTAVNLLGEIRLSAQARATPVVATRHFEVFPLDWPQFWMFQAGVGRVARFVCEGLEMGDLGTHAYLAGLLHDLGKLVLARSFPFALEAAASRAKLWTLPWAAAERSVLGRTSRELGLRYARRSGLPEPFCHVIQWAEAPETATADVDLVAVVAFARALCQRYQVGRSFEAGPDSHVGFESLPGWAILQQRVFVGFIPRKFQLELHGFCLRLKSELSGHGPRHSAPREEFAAT